MQTEYLDMFYKLLFYKEYLIKQFRENEEYINIVDINSHLDRINLHQSLFEKEYDIKTRHKLNMNDLNKYLYLIYNDLKILYNLLEKFSIERFNRLEDHIGSNLLALDHAVRLYIQRSQLELNSSFLGQTLLYRDSELQINNNIINLGEVDIYEGSEIACIISGNNLVRENIQFRFKKDGRTLAVGPYNFYQTSLTIPGNPETNVYKIDIPNVSEGGIIDLNINRDIAINVNNSYYAANGINKMKISDKITKEVYYVDTPNRKTTHIFNESYISFYVPKDSDISFEFSSQPIYTNFNATNIKTTDKDTQVIIESPADFIMSMDTDKDIYTDKQECYIDNNMIVYPKYTPNKDFLLTEVMADKKVTYDVSVEVLNSDAEIEYVAIKELIKT